MFYISLSGGGGDVKTRALQYKQKWADELAEWSGFGYYPSQDFAFKRTVWIVVSVDILSNEWPAWRPCALEVHLMGGPPRAIRSYQAGRMPQGSPVPVFSESSEDCVYALVPRKPKRQEHP